MGTQITFRRGSNDPTSGSGLTLAEPAFNTTLKTFHIGLGYGVTAAWVGAPISGLSADIAAGITYKIPTLAAVKNYVTSTSITDYVSSFNGRTGAIQGVSAAAAGDGIAVNGATGAVTITNTGVTRAVAGTGISVSGATGSVTITNIGVQSFNGNTGAVTGVASIRGLTGAVGITNGTGIGLSVSGQTMTFSNTGVLSVNGSTGTITNVAKTDETQTFTSTNTFNALTNFASGISAAGGVTFSGTLKGVTANFTGLVSSTIGFSGSAANLVGNASGLTAGTASKIQIAEAASAVYYLALAGGVGNTGIFVDTTVPRWSYNTSSGALITTTGSVEAASLIATSTGMISNTWAGRDGTIPMTIRGPYFDGTFQAIYIGDVDGDANSTTIELDDATGFIGFGANNIDAYGNLNVKNSASLAFYNATNSNYVAFKGPTGTAVNITWTLPSVDGSLNQVLTTNGSGTLSWTTPIGSHVTTYNGRTGAVQGVSAAVAGSGISVSGATGSVTITNTGVTGIRGGTGIFVSSTTGYPTIGVTLASGQSFIGADVNLTTLSTWYNVTGLTLDAGTWFVTGNLTCIRGGSGTRVFSIQLADITPTTYASAAQGMASVSGNSVQISCSAIITLATSKRINLQGMSNVTSTPSDYATYFEPQLGAINASGIVAFRIA